MQSDAATGILLGDIRTVGRIVRACVWRVTLGGRKAPDETHPLLLTIG